MNSVPPQTQSRQDLSADIERLGPWFHNLHLPGGAQTAPHHKLGDFPRFKWEQIAPHIPADLTGWTALDIGCNAGFYTIELARRGATVTAIDHDEQYLRQARWAAEQFEVGEQVNFRRMDVYDLARVDEQYDLVLFMGVFYHLRYPLLGLDIVAEKTKKLMVFQTLTMPGDQVMLTPHDADIYERDDMLRPGWPVMAFIEHRFAGDPTNWWAANHACVLAMLRSAGLTVTEEPGHEIYLCEPDGASDRDMRAMIRREMLAATGVIRSQKP